MDDIYYAVTPGHGENEPSPEISREELLEEYKVNLYDTIYGYVETYNEAYPGDKIEEVAINDWVEMEMMLLKEETGKYRLHDKLQLIKKKYEDETDKILDYINSRKGE